MINRKKSYKLIAIDIDGTLLNSCGDISERTKEVFKNAKEKGIRIVLASGRPIKSTWSLSRELDVDKFFIASNGAILADSENRDVLFNRFLKNETVLEFAKLCEKNSIYYNIYTTDEIITSKLKYNTIVYYKENSYKKQSNRTDINFVQNVYEYIKELECPKFLKITICDESKIVFKNVIRKIKEKFPDLTVLDTEHMSKKYIKQGSEQVLLEYYFSEISPNGINKWTALKYLLKHLNISDDEVITVGDNVNDIEMIKKAGLGVSMENAGDNIKEIADFVTTDNNNDGVAKVIEEYILN